jgi:hypothetical protein
VEFDLSTSRVESVELVEAYLKEVLLPFSENIIKGSHHLKTVELNKDTVSFKFQCLLKEKSDRDIEKAVRKVILRAAVRFSNGSVVSHQE